MRQKLDSAERQLHDNDLQIRELEDNKRDLEWKVQRMVEDIDSALSWNNNLDQKLTSVTEKFRYLENQADWLQK